ELDHAARLDVARATARPPRRLRVRPGSARAGVEPAAGGGAAGARSAGRARAAVIRQDLRLEGVPRGGAAGRRRRLSRRLALRAAMARLERLLTEEDWNEARAASTRRPVSRKAPRRR